MDEKNIDNLRKISESISNLQQLTPKQSKQPDKKTKKQKNDPDVIFQTAGNFVLADETGKEAESGKAKFVLDEEKISILSESGEAMPLLLRDIRELFSEDYRISVSLAGGGKIIISGLGYQYDDFFEALGKIRQEIIEKELLMKEGGKKAGFEGNYDYQKDGERRTGEAEIEISDSGLVIKPKQGDLIRIPFAEIIEFSEKDYKISIIADSASLSLSYFGEKFEPLSRALKKALNELSLNTQSILKNLLPEIDPLTIKKTSELLKDGRAASKDNIDEISSDIWPNLEKKLAAMNIKESYDFLMSLSKTKKVFIGIKRDLMGDLTGEYIWFLVPIYSEKGGDFLAMEAASTIEGGSKATYFFKTAEEKNMDDLIKKINRCMLAINFRREPIYLSDEDLEKPDYSRYKIAIGKIPELKLLRQLFAGRVAHTSPENWKENVKEIINKK